MTLAHAARSRRGMTLAEVMLAALVMGIIAGGAALLLQAATASSAGQADEARAAMLAEELAEEIRAKAFEDPDLAQGSFGTEEGSRSSYDDVDDYHGHSTSPPQDVAGTPMAQFSGFTRSVTVENLANIAGPASRTDFAAQTAGSTGFKRVKVRVTWAGGSKSVELAVVVAR